MAETTSEDPKKSSRIAKIRQTISLRGHFIGWMLAPVIGLIFFPSVILVVFCMLPTIVCYIIERQHEKHATRTVGYLNIASTFGLGWQLWTTDNSIQGALDILNNVLPITLVYLSALFGWIIYYFSRSIVDTYLQIAYEIRIRTARHRQIQLAKEWGPDVGEGAEELFNQSDDMTEQIDKEIEKLVQTSEKAESRLQAQIKKFTRRFFDIEAKVTQVAQHETITLLKQQQQEVDEHNQREFELSTHRTTMPTAITNESEQANPEKSANQ